MLSSTHELGSPISFYSRDLFVADTSGDGYYWIRLWTLLTYVPNHINKSFYEPLLGCIAQVGFSILMSLGEFTDLFLILRII